MFIAYAVLAVLLSIGLVGSAIAKLTRQQQIVDSMTTIGVPPSWLPFLAAAEIAGAAGLLIGLWVGWLGLAAGIGLIAYFIGAVGAHLRRSDFANMPGAAVFLVVVIVATALRAVTL